jgi:hypothetical protein
LRTSDTVWGAASCALSTTRTVAPDFTVSTRGVKRRVSLTNSPALNSTPPLTVIVFFLAAVAVLTPSAEIPRAAVAVSATVSRRFMFRYSSLLSFGSRSRAAPVGTP